MAYNKSQWFSGGVVIRGTEVLVFWYERKGWRVLKFPGGSQKTGNGRNDHTPEDTLREELVGDHELLQDGAIEVAEKFWENPISPDHTQHWFIVSPRGKFRDTEKVDQEEGEPDEFLSPPFWMPVVEVYRNERTARGHRQMIPHLAAYMAAKDREWAWVVKDLYLDEEIQSGHTAR